MTAFSWFRSTTIRIWGPQGQLIETLVSASPAKCAWIRLRASVARFLFRRTRGRKDSESLGDESLHDSAGTN